ncbi:hypothetical protein PR003_g18372 [Phytophthora rubi]|uniref:RxLR effector protein n=1 Tax=Phytophthora rubi TaxID=129364 RepID=A0A6A4E172_9STRA|nr:hypothetical protein PR002_g19336 [Phytophthora rubi]KAE9317881.1 hypothetical protein PR003_g18372 [Phytophthora rubi]
MPWYRIVFVVAVSLLVSSDAVLTTKESDEIKLPTVALTATVNSVNTIITETNKRRYLREDELSSIDGSIKSIDRRDDAPEEPGARAIESFNTLSRVKTMSGEISRTSKWLSEKVSQALPMKWRLRVWAKNEKSLDFVKKELGLEHLSADLLRAAPNFKYYDDYVTSQLPVWAKKQLTPTEVKAELGLEDLVDAALMTNPNFKYYDEFLKTQVRAWGEEKISVDDVLVRLGLNTLSGRARTEAVNFEYYDEFVVNQLRTWLKDNQVTVLGVMAKLNLGELSGEALLSHPNYQYYKRFVKSKLKLWAENSVPRSDVKAKLGLENLRGRTLESHPNFTFFQKYIAKQYEYQLDGWLKQGLSTFDIWQKLELDRVHVLLLRQSGVYRIYQDYVNLMDDYVLKLMRRGFDVPDLISKEASERELLLKTQIWTSAKRPEEYVKFALGLKGLEGDMLTAAPNYKFYEYYLEGLPHIK